MFDFIRKFFMSNYSFRRNPYLCGGCTLDYNSYSWYYGYGRIAENASVFEDAWDRHGYINGR